MTLNNIPHIRLVSQQLTTTTYKTAKEVVGWMGAMQAQDLAMAKWAIGIRLPNSTQKNIDEAINKGEIIRTHVLRPTWHFVSSDDIYWMLELTAPQIKTIAKSRHATLGLTADVLKKANMLIIKALSGGKHLTREALMAILNKAKITTDIYRSSHIMLCAELDGIVCSGAAQGNKPTYALLSERVKQKKSLTREEALAQLAQRYFVSHCPATLQDFIWWSGLSVKDARHGLEMVKSNFITETIGTETYWLTNTFNISKNKSSLYLLPAFDEFIISYRNRSASLPLDHHKKAISSNGIFRPVIVLNGQVIGLWKRAIKKDKLSIEANLFQSQHKSIIKLIEEAAEKFESFLDKKISIITI